MVDGMYPGYENLNQFIEECLAYAKVEEVYDCDGYTAAELLVLSIQPKFEKQIETLTAEIDRLKERFERVSGLLASAYTIADREGTSTNWPAFKDRAYEALHDLPQFALTRKSHKYCIKEQLTARSDII